MRFDVPKLADYSGAVQANQSMMNAFGNLANQSQDYLKMEEQKKTNAWNKAFEEQKFDETKNQNSIANKNTDRAFNYGATRDGVKDNQWSQDFGLKKDSVVFDQGYKNKVFNHNVNQDNIKNNQWGQAFANTVANQNKPDYSTFNGVDAQGNPILNMLDKNTGKVVNTGTRVYNEPKQLAPEQSMYYMDRANEIKQKQLTELEKDFRATNEFSELGEQDQLKAIDYLRTNGKLPQISYEKGMSGKGYYLPQNGSKQVDLKALENAINGL